MTSHLTCGVLFESDPVWLWSIRPNSWASIFITGPDESRLRQAHPVLYQRLKNKVVTITSTFGGDYPSVCPDYMWVSGSKCFLDMVILPPRGVHVYLLLKFSRRCPNDLDHIQWTRLTHRNVGGVTNARGTFGIDNRSQAIQIERDVSRSIGHILKYSLRPRVCDADPNVDHYDLNDLLSLSFPRRPVLYPTYMSRTGWGIRELGDLELSSCFELPDYVTWSDRFLRDIIPLQMCRSVIDSVTKTTLTEPPKRKHKTGSSDDFGAMTSTKDVFWLSGVGRWLPGSWADADISDKAVKSDNAPVDFRPWHRRIQLIMPCTVDTISVWERLATRKWRSNVCRSLFRYLSETYGPRWPQEGKGGLAISTRGSTHFYK